MKQNSTKNMIIRHLKDIKAKIEQKSINNIKLPFEGPFNDKYAGRSPERILCLNSVRLVFFFLSLSLSSCFTHKVANQNHSGENYSDERKIKAIK